MPSLTLKRRLAEGRAPNSIALNGVVYASETLSVSVDVGYKYVDDPTMEWQSLVTASTGYGTEVPIDLKGRQIVLAARSLTEKGKQSVTRYEEGEQLLFTPSDVPVLVDAVFSTPNVNLTITDNGGVGDISILRSIDGGVYGEIGTVAFDDPTYSDTPAINGTYRYKLTQEGQTGESNVKTVVITTVGAGAGSPPTLLDAVYDPMTFDADLSWTNNGGTGSVIVERSMNGLAYILVDTLATATVVYTDNVPPTQSTRYYNYRVSNTSVAGYSNLAEIVVEAL